MPTLFLTSYLARVAGCTPLPKGALTMGWISGDHRHEGWAARVAAHDKVPSAADGGGAIIGLRDDFRKESYSADRKTPDSEVIGWRGTCSCGWRGNLWERKAAMPADDDSHGQDKITLDGVIGPYRKIEEAICDEWRAHLSSPDPAAAAAAIAAAQRAANEYESARQQFEASAAAARAAGASWAKIGRAAGLTRQGAFKRWAGRL